MLLSVSRSVKPGPWEKTPFQHPDGHLHWKKRRWDLGVDLLGELKTSRWVLNPAVCFPEEESVFHPENIIERYANNFSTLAVTLHTHLLWRHDKEGRPIGAVASWVALAPKGWGPTESYLGQQLCSGGGLTPRAQVFPCDGLERGGAGPSLLGQRLPRQAIPQLISQGIGRPEKWMATPLSGEKPWACPCLLDSLQLRGRLSFPQFRNGCGKQPASVLHQGQRVIPLPTQAATCRTDTARLVFQRFGTKKGWSPSREAQKKGLYWKQGYFLKIWFPILPAYHKYSSRLSLRTVMHIFEKMNVPPTNELNLKPLFRWAVTFHLEGRMSHQRHQLFFYE